MNRKLFPYARKVEAPPQPPWDGPAEVRRLVVESREMQELFETLGYSFETETAVAALMVELKGLVRAEIPDFRALRDTLGEIEEQLAELAEGYEEDDLMAAARAARRDDPLLTAVLAAGDDEVQVLGLLNDDPVDRVLPFVEEIPFQKGEVVVWRMPVDVTLIRKQPSSSTRLAEILEELERVVETAQLLRREKSRQDVVDVLARLRWALERERANWPLLIQALDGKVTDWLTESPDEASDDRREELEGFLEDLLHGRRLYGDGDGLDGEGVADFQETARRLAALYLDRDWMHVRWLTDSLLDGLLASELAAIPDRQRGDSERPEGVLQLVATEVATRCFDRVESTRRLRDLEEYGLFVNSLAYGLLRV